MYHTLAGNETQALNLVRPTPIINDYRTVNASAYVDGVFVTWDGDRRAYVHDTMLLIKSCCAVIQCQYRSVEDLRR